MKLNCGRYELSLDRPLVMGIVNLTPDSFSGDGITGDLGKTIEHARSQIAAGADLLDLGAESSRPGALPTSEHDELARLLPVLDALRDCGLPLSVDTYKPAVMRAALAAGASMINDIYGFRLPGALDAVATANCGLCVMHMQGEPLSMQLAPGYSDVADEVAVFLSERMEVLIAAGVTPARICIDPGFGFGKTLDDNLALFNALPRIAASAPVLVGVSRKSMLGQITGKPVAERVAASVAAAVLAVERGASILRVHDVAATCDALAVLARLQSAASKNSKTSKELA